MILDIIQYDLKLQLVDKPVTNASFEHPILIDGSVIKDGDIEKLLRKQVIEEVTNDNNTGYYSKHFTNKNMVHKEPF